MTEETLLVIFKTGHYFAYLTWIVLVILAIRLILKKEYSSLKTCVLYLLNTVSYILAYGLYLELALIVSIPFETTKAKSIVALRDQADSFFYKFILFAFVMTCILTLLNIIYLKYFAKTIVLKHTLILFISNLIFLSVASYVSTELYFTGLLQEIDRHFN